jgi:hypothetical protein
MNKNISEFQELIENKNPQVKVVMLSSHKQVGKVLNDSLQAPVSNLTPKKPKKRFHEMLYKAAVYPITFLTKEFKISKFVAIFILTFTAVGIISVIGYFLYVKA